MLRTYPTPAKNRKNISHQKVGENAEKNPAKVLTASDAIKHARRPIRSATVPHIQPPNVIPIKITAANHPYSMQSNDDDIMSES
jgi:hypothetical protein